MCHTSAPAHWKAPDAMPYISSFFSALCIVVKLTPYVTVAATELTYQHTGRAIRRIFFTLEQRLFEASIHYDSEQTTAVDY